MHTLFSAPTNVCRTVALPHARLVFVSQPEDLPILFIIQLSCHNTPSRIHVAQRARSPPPLWVVVTSVSACLHSHSHNHAALADAVFGEHCAINQE
eukprot:m.23607 g.23607  ORF g.23607 m.23607 type:complete len:96 (-) comp8520_c0_seq1:1558-1845(-)